MNLLQTFPDGTPRRIFTGTSGKVPGATPAGIFSGKHQSRPPKSHRLVDPFTTVRTAKEHCEEEKGSDDAIARPWHTAV